MPKQTYAELIRALNNSNIHILFVSYEALAHFAKCMDEVYEDYIDPDCLLDIWRRKPSPVLPILIKEGCWSWYDALPAEHCGAIYWEVGYMDGLPPYTFDCVWEEIDI